MDTEISIDPQGEDKDEIEMMSSVWLSTLLPSSAWISFCFGHREAQETEESGLLEIALT